RHRAARGLRPRLRARDHLRDRHREHPRRDSVPARTAPGRVLVDVLGRLAAYAAAATGGAPVGLAKTPEQLGAAGAIASHFLAVTSSRSLSLVGGDDAVHSLVAHQTWFKPSDVRC